MSSLIRPLRDLDPINESNTTRQLGREAADEIERLRKALEFYADESAWNQPPVKVRAGLLGDEYENQASKVRRDRGRIARQALTKPPETGSES